VLRKKTIHLKRTHSESHPVAAWHCPAARWHEKIRDYFQLNSQATTMIEAERINAIGAQLSDLSARALSLRGYL